MATTPPEQAPRRPVPPLRRAASWLPAWLPPALALSGTPLPVPAAEAPPPAAPAQSPSLAAALARVDAALTKARAALETLERTIAAQDERIGHLRGEYTAAADPAARQAYQETLLDAARVRDDLRRRRTGLAALVEQLGAQRAALEPPR